MFTQLFKSIRIKNVELKNRLIVPPMVTNYCTEDGNVTDRFIDYHEARAKGGFSLITIEQTAISKSGKGHPFQPGIWEDEQIEGLSRLTDRIHASGGKISVQLNHAGRSTRSAFTGTNLVAPSAIKDPVLVETPVELTIAEIHEIVKQFGAAASRAKEAGFDMVTMHAHARYLVANFLSPLSNKRTDQYGGTLLNRARFALEVLESIRTNVGPDFPIIYRFSADELVEGGLSIYDTLALAPLIEAAGADVMDVSVGNAFTSRYITQPTAVSHAFIADIAQQFKTTMSVPIAVAGRINDPLIAESILFTNKADLISMGRASLADPEFPNKVKEGKLDRILYCVGCCQGCVGSVRSYRDINCLVNPTTGHEKEYEIKESAIRKKILVAGGGPAGMEAAIVAARRGHEVHLYEKSGKLGGQWLLAAVPPTKTECNTLTIWQKNQLNELGILTYLNTEVTAELIEREKPDAVIFSVGATPVIPKIKGVDRENVVQAFNVLNATVDVGDKVAIIGGGLVGAETAYHLALHGKEVVLIEMLDQIVKDGEPSPNAFLIESLKRNNVTIVTSAEVLEIKAGSIIYRKGAVTDEISNIDHVILAVGARSVNIPFEKTDDTVPEVIVIGDAKQTRKAIDAVREGFRAGLTM